VNPAQFGPQEDFQAYPRTLKEDLAKLAALKVEFVFNPDVKEMYPGQTVYVDENELTTSLCGRHRTGHFRGVLTVVLKFFNIIKPTRAYFGKKDYQQWRLIDKMVKDLNLDLDVIGCPIIRDMDGLALSSRNSYLNSGERVRATVIYKAIQTVRDAYRKGETRAATLNELAKEVMDEIRVQYIEFVDSSTLKLVDVVNDSTLFAIAAYVGQTRLIDNSVLGEE
jgi:pantoate--beta-alanine ligase